jgi:heat-inducible transcriptional repressor
MSKNHLNERSQEILKTLVSFYIREGQPVASKTIAEGAPLAISPATIRNILAELEEAGYLQSPHTSAGRVPTVLGYRFFVNSLLSVKKEIDAIPPAEANVYLDTNTSEQALIESASTLISSITKLTGIVTIPRHDHVIFRHIEFLPLTNKRILVILVLNEQEVQNLIIQTDREYSEGELQQAANYLIAHYTGKNLIEIQQNLLNEMRYDHKNIEHIMQKVFDSAEQNVMKQQEAYVIAGESNLLDLAEENGVDHLRRLFNAFAGKNDILHLLDKCLQSEGIQIFIGQESGNHVFNGCSLIAAPYTAGEKMLGVLGVIGPTRMDYERVISAVDVTAKLLSGVLKDRISN